MEGSSRLSLGGRERTIWAATAERSRSRCGRPRQINSRNVAKCCRGGQEGCGGSRVA